VLFSRKARINSLFFLVGWSAGLIGTSVVVGILLYAGVTLLDSGNGAFNLGFINLIFGALLFAAAYWEWRNRTPSGEEPVMPKWMAAIDGITPGKTVGLAIFLVMLPKNLMLNITSTTAIVSASITAGQKLLAFLVFFVVANLMVAAIVLIYWLFGERAERMLNTWKAWMIRHNSTVLISLYLFYGLLLTVPQVISFFQTGG